MSRKNQKLGVSAIRKEYGVSPAVLKKFLPRPDQYAKAGGGSIPLWKRATVEAILADPAVADFQKKQAEKQQPKPKEPKAKKPRLTRKERAARRAQKRAEKEAALREYLLQYDISSLIEMGKSLDRRFILHCGPTNSGKTYQSLLALRQTEKGCYLGPLRLLALEVFDTLNEGGVPCSLLTGEEAIEVPFSRVTASTVEMADFSQDYDTAVIDEAQLLTDRTRGGHWLSAILRIRAKEVHICTAPEGLPLGEQLIAQMESPCEIRQYDRLAPLVFRGNFPKHKYAAAQPGDAFIAFSRKAVLAIAAELALQGIRASVIYGALPPPSRREEVRKFTSGETTVVAATDAIGMGVSLPIRRVIFCQTNKYDGIEYRPLTPTEIKQIGGRAGRFGQYDEGQVLAMEHSGLIAKALNAPAEPFTSITIPFPQEALGGPFTLSDLLDAWQKLPPVEGFRYEDMTTARILYRNLKEALGDAIGNYPEHTLLRYISCPADTGNPAVVGFWVDLTAALLQNAPVLPEPRIHLDTLEDCETAYKKLDLQRQLLGRAGIRLDTSAKKREVEQRINELLLEDKSGLRRTCTRCGKVLKPTARFNLCRACMDAIRAEQQRQKEEREAAKGAAKEE